MRKIFKNLTPKTAFDKYVDTGQERPVEFFLLILY